MIREHHDGTRDRRRRRSLHDAPRKPEAGNRLQAAILAALPKRNGGVVAGGGTSARWRLSEVAKRLGLTICRAALPSHNPGV
jgi:hypothetical protein